MLKGDCCIGVTDCLLLILIEFRKLDCSFLTAAMIYFSNTRSAAVSAVNLWLKREICLVVVAPVWLGKSTLSWLFDMMKIFFFLCQFCAVLLCVSATAGPGCIAHFLQCTLVLWSHLCRLCSWRVAGSQWWIDSAQLTYVATPRVAPTKAKMQDKNIKF